MSLSPLLSNLYEYVVVGKEKAVVAFVVAGGVSLLAQHLGYHVSDGLQQAATSLLLGLLAHFSVYLTQNRKP